MTELLTAAKEYASIGWRVLPILPDPEHGTKKPPVSYKNLRHAEPEVFPELFQKYPQCKAIAKIVSDNEIVIDIDGGEWPEMPVTPTLQTVRGYHYHFKRPLSLKMEKSQLDFEDGMEVKGPGMLANIPPGEHPSGFKYQWIHGPETPLAELPGWITDKINKYSETSKEGKKMSSTDLDGILQGVKEGEGRNKACIRLGGHYIGKGLTWPEISMMLDAWNMKNNPPLSTSEMRSCKKSLQKMCIERDERKLEKQQQKKPKVEKKPIPEIKEAQIKLDIPESQFEKQEVLKDFMVQNFKGYDKSSLEAFADEFLYPVSGVDTKTKFNTIVRDAWSTIKEDLREENKQNSSPSDSECFTSEDCMQEVMQIHPVFVIRDTLEFYLYDTGYYKRLGTRKTSQPIRRTIREVYKDHSDPENPVQPTAEQISSVLTLMEDTQYIEREDLGSLPKDKICLQNGVYDLKTGKLLPHSPKYKLRVKLPVKYNPDAKCPEILKLFDTLIDVGTIERIDQQGILEWFGYCLIPDNSLQKAAFMIGEKGSGKTTIILLLQELIGKENISNESLQKLEEDRFSVAQLDGKLANTCPDLPAKTIYDSPVFKALVGGDTVRGERKGIDAFNFENTARLMFAANEPPHIHRSREAFFRRVLSFIFKKSLPEELKDKKIIEKITTEEELSGLLNLALKALADLQERGSFINEKSIEETEKLYSLKSEPVVMFADECLSDGEYTPKDEVYAFYKHVWCPKRGVKPEKPQTFKKSLKNFAGVEDADRKGPDGDLRPRGYAVELISVESFSELVENDQKSEKPPLNQLEPTCEKRYQDQLNQLENTVLNKQNKNVTHNKELLYEEQNKRGLEDRGFQVGLVGPHSENHKLVQAGSGWKEGINPEFFSKVAQEFETKHKTNVNSSNLEKFVIFAWMRFGQAQITNISREALTDYAKHYFKLSKVPDTEIIVHTPESAKAAIEEMLKEA